MASRAADSSSKPKIPLEEIMEKGYESLIAKIKQLKTEIEAGRCMQVKEKLDKSGKKLGTHTSKLSLAAYMVDPSVENGSIEVPRVWAEKALCVLDSVLSGSEDKDFADIHEAISSSSITLPKIQRIPPYTTWMFLNRNQRMAEEQSVVGRRHIYYDQSGNEALVCSDSDSDSDDDLANIDEEKRAFSEGEDQIVWMAFQEHGLTEDVADVVSHFIGGTSSEILERYHELKQKHAQGSTESNVLLEKSLSSALDSLDNLFCRRCLVFDCGLHGCSQTLVYPSEKPLGGLEYEDRKPCSDQCYLVGIFFIERFQLKRCNRAGQTVDNPVEISNVNSSHQMEGSIVGVNSGPRVRSKNNMGIDNADKEKRFEFEAEVDEGPAIGLPSVPKKLTTEGHKVVGKRKTFVDNGEQFQSTDSFMDAFDKKQKNIQAAEVEIVSAKAILSAETKILEVMVPGEKTSQLADKLFTKGLSTRVSHKSGDELCVISKGKVLSRSSEWMTLEKDLYTKGLEIFGRNSCLIARNLLSGLKNCTEIFNYMRNNGAAMTHKKDIVRSLEDRTTADTDYTEQDMLLRSRSRIFRRRGRARRLTYSSKSSGLPSSWKKIGDEKQASKQYSPCTCQAMCGKDCSCLKIGTCCEKYCGCPKSCKNRFRGCHCAKSQCRSRQCPCFAANRECDPDVCRNCWVSCGGGSFGEPLKKGDGQWKHEDPFEATKEVLLGRSDLTGWGAFSKDPVNKNEYLGEYTGELISHQEADKRGEIYDLANSSFLFDLNDQYVLDACRHGNKLKFANHSSNPNCFCKVMLVGGDHRVGIFAKERIEAQEEVFYDYCYGPDQAPEWARKPESSKKEDSLASQSRPRKHQSL